MTPHDALFKAAFSEPARAAEALAYALGPQIARLIDFTTLRLIDSSFVDEELRARHADLLYAAQLAGSPALFHLLFEHQSGPEWKMALRLLRYMLCDWDAHLAEHPQARSLPLVIPVVMTHCERGWTGRAVFEDLVELPAAARDALLPFVPKFRFVVDDLTASGAAALHRRAVTVQLRLVLLALLEGRRAPHLGRLLHSWLDLFSEAGADPRALRVVELVIRYIVEVRGASEYADAYEMNAREISTRLGNKTMETIADMLRAQGRQEGRQEGLLEGERVYLRKLLTRRFGELPPRLLARLAAADSPTLERWGGLLLGAPGVRSLDELLDA